MFVVERNLSLYRLKSIIFIEGDVLLTSGSTPHSRYRAILGTV